MKTLVALAVIIGLFCFAIGRELPEIKWDYDITIQSLRDGNTQPDRDVIVLLEQEMCTPPGYIMVEIQLVNPLTWWKGLRLHAKTDTSYWKPVVEIKENQTGVRGLFLQEDLISMELVLWKAKVFGAYTSMYRISDALDSLTPGTFYKFMWAQDG